MKEKLRKIWTEWQLAGFFRAFAAIGGVMLLFWGGFGGAEGLALSVALLLLSLLLGLPAYCAVTYPQVKAGRERAAREKTAEEASAPRRRARGRDGESARDERYSDAEREVLERYIRDASGAIARTFYDGDAEGLRLDVAVSEPSAEREFYTLTTLGMGARRMDVPAELAEKNQAFAELTMLLPPDWDIMNDTWPFRVLRETAKRPFAEGDHIQVGNAYRGKMMDGSGFFGVLVVYAAVREGSGTRLMLPSGKVVNFYLLLPIFESEWDYILRRDGSYPLWRRYADRVRKLVVDPERESCVGKAWFEEDIAPFLWREAPEGGEWYLSLDALSWQEECFRRARREGDGYGWEKLAQAFLQKYRERDAELVEFDSDANMFFAASRDELALRRFALNFHDFCADGGALEALLKEAAE